MAKKRPPARTFIHYIMDSLISLADYQHMAFFEKGSINHFEQNFLFRGSTSITEFALKNGLFCNFFVQKLFFK